MCFAAVAVAFTIGIGVAELVTMRIRSAAREITGNSSPSIVLLSAIRSAVRELEVLTDDQVDDCGVGRCGQERPARIAELRRALVSDWTNYQRLPTFPDESERWRTIGADLRALEEALTRTLDAAAAGREAEAKTQLDHRLKPACDQLDTAVAELIRYDHDQGVAVAGRIESYAQDGLLIAIFAVFLCIVLTVAAAILATQTVRRYEDALLQRAHELDQFAGRIAHDIMSPLAGTSAALHVARFGATEQAKLAIERGERGVQRVRRLVEDLLEFARAGAEAPAATATDLTEVIEDVVTELQPVAEQRAVHLRVEVATRERIACSPGVLTSIVSNLVRNAITHMGASATRNVEVRAFADPTRRGVRIEVQDTGPGIPPSVGERVFEPFVRGPGTEEKGTGLGLATAKRLVSAHGGRIGFSSRPGAGTVFWFEMPACAGERPAVPR